MYLAKEREISVAQSKISKGLDNMNIKRILTSLIGFPIVMCILILGNKYIIDIIIAIIAIIAMKEYINCSSNKVKVISWISYLAAASIGLLHIIPSSIIKSYLFMINMAYYYI